MHLYSAHLQPPWQAELIRATPWLVGSFDIAWGCLHTCAKSASVIEKQQMMIFSHNISPTFLLLIISSSFFFFLIAPDVYC